MNEETQQKKGIVEEFFKAAFCVDGAAKFVPKEGFKIEGVIELTDSERGTFYVAKVTKSS